MALSERLSKILPGPVKNRVESYFEAVDLLREVRDPRTVLALGPSGVRGLLLRRGKTATTTRMPASHSAHFDWEYRSDQPEMRRLYSRAKAMQWDSETDLKWDTSVDPVSPDKPLLPETWIAWDVLEKHGVRLTPAERRETLRQTCAWMLSQFLHGEQAALFAAAQVTEAVQFFDGKLFGATQVVDEGRHVEAFHRYLDTKIERVYQVNDNLFVLIDAIMTDGRWDMKFLGMQILVEGLALGAFGALYKQTREPLLRELLKMVIRDEARHVHYGVLALREHFCTELSDRERREREEWAFEVCLLMRNRFLAHEIYEESFQHRMSRKAWAEAIEASHGMAEFRKVMFSRLVPNLREIGLMSRHMLPRYEKAGLMHFFNGKAATLLNEDQVVRELEPAEAAE